MGEIELTPEQAAEADRIADVLRGAMLVEAERIARLLASKKNQELFGETEFQLRDLLHKLGARALDTALSERKKGGTEGRASCVRAAARTPGSWDTADAT